MEDLPFASYDTPELENFHGDRKIFVAQIALPRSISIDKY